MCVNENSIGRWKKGELQRKKRNGCKMEGRKKEKRKEFKRRKIEIIGKIMEERKEGRK